MFGVWGLKFGIVPIPPPVFKYSTTPCQGIVVYFLSEQAHLESTVVCRLWTADPFNSRLCRCPTCRDPYRSGDLFHSTPARFQKAIFVRSCGTSSGLPARTEPARSMN